MFKDNNKDTRITSMTRNELIYKLYTYPTCLLKYLFSRLAGTIIFQEHVTLRIEGKVLLYIYANLRKFQFSNQ